MFVGTDPEGVSDFDFEDWICDHGLDDVEYLFISHRATTRQSLKLNAPEFQAVMADAELLSTPQMIPVILSAVHAITPIAVRTVVISEDEQSVNDSIERLMEQIDEIEGAFHSLSRHCVQSRESLDAQKWGQIESAKANLNRLFDALLESLTLRKRLLMDQLDAMRPVGDEEESKVISSNKENIDKMKQFLRKSKAEYDRILQSDLNRKERERRILRIGRNAESAHSIAFGAVQKSMADLQCAVRGRYSSRWNIAVCATSEISSFFEIDHELQRSFVYESDGDRNGILFYLGSDDGRRLWSNPAIGNEMKVIVAPNHQFIERADAVIHGLTDWFCVDFRRMRVKPTSYTLRHCETLYLRSWLFEGRLGNDEWDIISEHLEDEAVNEEAAYTSWSIECDSFFSEFRVRITPCDNSGDEQLPLFVSGFEIYGTLAMPQQVNR